MTDSALEAQEPPVRMRTDRERAVVVTTDAKGRIVFRELDLDLAERALTEHYKRRQN